MRSFRYVIVLTAMTSTFGSSAWAEGDCAAILSGLKEIAVQADNLRSRMSAIKAQPHPNYRDAELCAIATNLKAAGMQVTNNIDPSCKALNGADVDAFRQHWDDAVIGFDTLAATSCSRY